MRTLRLLNKDGDRILVWDEDDDQTMISFIQKKMDAGYTFFIVDRNIEPGTEIWKPLKNTTDSTKTRRVSMNDPEAETLVNQGVAGVAKKSADNIVTKGIAKTAKDVVKNNTVAVGALRGG